MDLRDVPAEVVDQRIGKIMDGYYTVVIAAETNGVYRARRNHNGKPFESASDLWYPPASVIRARGRFNEPGESVFYACNRAPGAVFEIRPRVGDLITLLIARTKSASVTLQSAHIGLERSIAPELDEAQRHRMLRQNPHFQEMLKHNGISKKWLAVDEFLSDIATTLFTPDEEQEKYRITNAIGRLLFKIPSVEALNYPSVATGLRNLNVCLKPEIADRYFMPSEAWMIKIEEAATKLPGLNEPGPFYRTTFFRKSLKIKTDGEIVWSDPLQNVQPEEIAHLAYRSRLPGL